MMVEGWGARCDRGDVCGGVGGGGGRRVLGDVCGVVAFVVVSVGVV